MFVVGIFLFTGISESIKQRSLAPLGTEVGLRLVAVDAMIGETTISALNPDTGTMALDPLPEDSGFIKKCKHWIHLMWLKVKVFAIIGGGLWFIFLYPYILYKLISGQNTSSAHWNWTVSIAVMLILFSFGNLMYYVYSNQGKTLPNEGYAAIAAHSIPLKGTVTFIKHVPDLIKSRYSDINEPVVINGEEIIIDSGTMNRPEVLEV